MSDSRYFGFQRAIETTVSLHRSDDDDDGTVTVSMVVSEYDPSSGETQRMVVRMSLEQARELGEGFAEIATEDGDA